jgi:hypothetical protein
VGGEGGSSSPPKQVAYIFCAAAAASAVADTLQSIESHALHTLAFDMLHSLLTLLCFCTKGTTAAVGSELPQNAAGSELWHRMQAQSCHRAHNSSEPVAESQAALSQWQSHCTTMCVLILVAAAGTLLESYYSPSSKSLSLANRWCRKRSTQIRAQAQGVRGGGVSRRGGSGGGCASLLPSGPVRIRPMLLSRERCRSPTVSERACV